jgi:O-antigen/teichoic acid export membrane protein
MFGAGASAHAQAAAKGSPPPGVINIRTTPGNTLAPQTSVLSSNGSAEAMVRSTVFGVVAGLAHVSTRILTVPIVVRYLGLDGYGIWSIVMATAAYMRFGSVGIKAAFQIYVAEASASGDYDRANKLLSTGAAGILVLSIAGLIPIAIYSSSLASAAGVPAAFIDSAAGAISVLAAIMVLSNGGAVYEGIVMGAHRVDLVRKFSTAFTILEAVAIVACLRFGLGLVALAVVMAASELAYLCCCFVAAHRVASDVRVGMRHVSIQVLPELVRFAGSYQLVSLFEVLYAAILPVALLNVYGATAAGVYAVASRLVGAALLPQEAFLVPLLSGGSAALASGSRESVRQLVAHAFKMTLILVTLPLALVAAHGETMMLAWTGQADPSFVPVLRLLCLAAFLKSISLLQLVLYRASGRSVVDNVRQVLRLALLLLLSSAAARLGFLGVLAGLAVTELAGVIFMSVATRETLHGFKPEMLIPDCVKMLAATLIIVAAGRLMVIVVGFYSLRADAQWRGVIGLLEIGLATAAVTWPALVLTGVLSQKERGIVVRLFKGREGTSAIDNSPL